MTTSDQNSQNFSILPYDFVKENQILATKTNTGYEVISPKKISPSLYHEISKFLKHDFSFKLCDSKTFNELLTNSFSIVSTSDDISEELSDEFDLESFAGSINATEDLLRGDDETPIIKLINGVISLSLIHI